VDSQVINNVGAGVLSSTIALELIKGLPAALVALIVAYIAWRQYRLAAAKLKLDLFDKRYEVFEQTWSILSMVIQKGINQPATVFGTPFNNFTAKVRFLFGKDVSDYVSEAQGKWVDLWEIECSTQANGGVVQPGDAAKRAVLMKWFHHEANHGVKDVFGRYLNFEKWK
jgi:hypothetical protein